MQINALWAKCGILLLAGALQTLVYAPFNLWPISVLSAAIAFYFTLSITKKESYLLGWFFGLGIFGSGASWVYVSIHDHGYASIPLATLLTFLFVAFLALFQALHFRIYHQARSSSPLFSIFVFTATWVLIDWFRSWFLTGFPWLYLGHGHLSSPLAGYAPIGGVHLLTWITVFTGASLSAVLVMKTAVKTKTKWLPLLASIILWIAGTLLSSINWTKIDKNDPIKVAIAQGNIPQELKWAPQFREETLRRYHYLSNNYWGYDLVLWPETAIPILMDQATAITNPLSEFAKMQNTALITGIPYRAPYKISDLPVYHNSIVSLGNGEGVYHKQKLVPFGEYVPLESYIRGLIKFFDLPMSSFSIGPSNQAPLLAGEYKISPFICYEIVYPDFVATSAREADLLLTISNDAWFGASIGPNQHLEIAQMRALETGRYLIRGTNSGISAIVDDKGQIVDQSPQFVEFSLSGEVFSASGWTPYMRWLSWPVLILCGLLTAIGWVKNKRASAQDR